MFTAGKDAMGRNLLGPQFLGIRYCLRGVGGQVLPPASVLSSHTVLAHGGTLWAAQLVPGAFLMGPVWKPGWQTMDPVGTLTARAPRLAGRISDRTGKAHTEQWRMLAATLSLTEPHRHQAVTR